MPFLFLALLLLAPTADDVKKKRGDRAALLKIHAEAEDAEVRALAVVALCPFYPKDAKLIHAHLLDKHAKLRHDVLRALRTRKLPDKVQKKLEKDPVLKAPAQRHRLLHEWELHKKPSSFFRRAGEAARVGIAKHRREAFVRRFRQRPDRDTLRGLAWKLRDPQSTSSEKYGAHRLLQSITGRTLPPDPAAWNVVAKTIRTLPQDVVIVETRVTPFWWRWLLWGKARR